MMEPLVTDHVLTVLLREGYLDGLQKRLEDLEGSARADAVAKQQKIERQISQADQDMRKLIKLQLDSEDMDLKGIYDDQLKETKGKKDRLSLELRELNDTLADEITASEIRAVVEISAKEIQKAWPKTPPSLRKRLLRTLVDRLIFNADCIDIFYLRGTTSAVTVPELSENCPSRNKILAFKKPENSSENENKSHEGEPAWPYKLAANDTTPLPSSPSHSAKVKGWYVIKNGWPFVSYFEQTSSTPYAIDILEFQQVPLYRDKAFLHQKYVVEGLSLKEIAAQICSSKAAVLKGLRDAKIPTRKTGGQVRRRFGDKPDKRTQDVNYLAEKRVLKAILEMKKQNLSLGQIARFLNQTGVPAPRDSQKWYPETVRRIILSEDKPRLEVDPNTETKDQLSKDIS